MTWTVSDSWTQLPGAIVVVMVAPLSVVNVTEPVATNSGLLQGSKFVAKQSTGNSTLESRMSWFVVTFPSGVPLGGGSRLVGGVGPPPRGGGRVPPRGGGWGGGVCFGGAGGARRG